MALAHKLIPLLLLAPLAHPAVLVFTDRPTFNAAAPANLNFEDFEEGVLASGTAAGLPSVLDQFSNSAVFAPGDISPGLRIEIAQSIFAGRDWRRFPSLAIMNNAEGDPTTITFPAITVTALGFDFFGTFFENGPALLTAYDESNNVLWSDTFTPPGSGQFIGLISDIPIARLTSNNGIAWYGFDNIAFGAETPVPEPATWVLTAAALLALRSLKPQR
jgi:hypothetical protein